MNTPAQPTRILVVDDVLANLKLVIEILSGQGYQVRPASSGTMALRSVEVEQPDLILLDVRMPEMDGYEVCRRLKAEARSRSIPVIFLSALDDTADKIKGFEAGGVDYITKPFQPMEMLKRIETHLALQRLQHEVEAQNLQLRHEIVERQRAEALLKAHEADLENQVAARTAALEEEIRGHQRTEQTLRDSQQRLADIINLLPDPTFAIDLQGRVILWNRAAEEFTGIGSADMLGKDNYEYALPFYGERRPMLLDFVLHPSGAITSFYSQIRQEQGLVMAEAYTRSVKGGDAYLLITAAPLFDAQGAVIGAIESLRDITVRQRHEEALRESEKRLTQFFDFLPDATFAIDIDGRVIAWNQAIEELTGVKAEAMLGRGNFAYSVPFYGRPRPILIDLVFKPEAEIQGHYAQARKEGAYLLAESEMTLRGERRVLWGIARPLFDCNGNMVGAIESVRDITDRRRAEEALKLGAERLHALLRINQMGEASLGEIVNYVFEEVVRLTQSAIGYLGFLNDDESTMHLQVWSRNVMPACRLADNSLHMPVAAAGLWGEAVRQRRPIITNDYQAPNPLKKGCPEAHIPLRRHMNVPLLVGEKIVLVAGVGNKVEEYDQSDVQQLTLLMEGMWRIVERKRAETAIREANERFKSVLRAATAYSIIGTDPEGVIKIYNEGAELMLGYDAEEVVDRATLALFHSPEEIAARGAALGIEPGFEVLVAAARRGETETREWTYILKGGARRTVSQTVTAMHNESGLLSGFIGIARDITAEKKLEQQFIQSQKMECVGLLAGGVAHDFNNLLTPILGYADLLIRGFAEDDSRRKRLLQMKAAAERAKDLTHRLLVFSRKQVIELKTLDLGDIVSQFEKILRRTIRENIAIKVVVVPQSGKVRVDAGQIELVLLNLSINAQDAMVGGGELTIEVREVDLDAAFTANHAGLVPGPYVMLAVSDTGVGMDGQMLEHIFEPFFTTKETGKGTGLGLSTVYGIVKQHGGAIYVSSEVNRGTVFKVYLPRVDAEGMAAEPSPPQEETVTQGGETILVAEDSEIVRFLAVDMLESFGYRVLSAEGPERAIEMAAAYQGRIDLLLTDVVMPGMNGRELYQRLHPTRPELKVLFMSGYTSNVIGQHGVLDQEEAFVQKPFTLQSLSEKIRQVLDG